MNIAELLNEMEDEHEVILNPVDKPSISLLKFLRKEFGLTPLEAKDFIKYRNIIYTELKLVEVESKIHILQNLGAYVEIHKTGDEYLKNYAPKEVEITLLGANIEGLDISDFFTTNSFDILYEHNGHINYYLIDDENLAKACCKYLLEKGQFREELIFSTEPVEVVEIDEVEN